MASNLDLPKEVKRKGTGKSRSKSKRKSSMAQRKNSSSSEGGVEYLKWKYNKFGVIINFNLIHHFIIL